MPKRLLILNVLLGGVGLFCVAFIVQQLVWAPPPLTGRPRPVTPPSGPAGRPPVPHAPVSAYNVIASRSLFSPTRSEAPATATTRSEEHTSELQSLAYLVCRLLLEKKKTI